MRILYTQTAGRNRNANRLACKSRVCVCMCVCVISLQSCPTLRPYGLQPTRLLRPWGSPGKNAGVGCHFLLQGIFQTPAQIQGVQHCKADSLLSEPPGKPLLGRGGGTESKKCAQRTLIFHFFRNQKVTCLSYIGAQWWVFTIVAILLYV